MRKHGSVARRRLRDKLLLVEAELARAQLRALRKAGRRLNMLYPRTPQEAELWGSLFNHPGTLVRTQYNGG